MIVGISAVVVTSCGVPDEQLSTQATVAQTDGLRPADATTSTPAPTDRPVAVVSTTAPATTATGASTSDLQAFIDAYEKHPMWGTFDPPLASLEMWRDRLSSYLVIGKIVGSRVVTRPYFPAETVPCSSEKPDGKCQITARDVVRFVVDLRPFEPPTLLPAGQRQGVKVPDDLVSIEMSIGFVDASNRDVAEAEAAAMAQSLTESLPIGATMETVVWVEEAKEPDGRPTHFGLLAAMWALVGTDGRLLVARLPEWPADSGLAPFSTVDESMAVLLWPAG